MLKQLKTDIFFALVL